MSTNKNTSDVVMEQFLIRNGFLCAVEHALLPNDNNCTVRAWTKLFHHATNATTSEEFFPSTKNCQFPLQFSRTT